MNAYITSAYRTRADDKQGIPGAEPVEILNIVADRYLELEDEHPDHTKWAVLTLWQHGRFHSLEAIFWLQIFQHISAGEIIENHDAYMRSYVSRERARAEGRAA